jgi:adenine-specific DNA-methyltransferase
MVDPSPRGGELSLPSPFQCTASAHVLCKGVKIKNRPASIGQLALPLSVPATTFGRVITTASAPPASRRQKDLGAFYTPPEMARVLTDWALRDPSDIALDPSFGGLVFLQAARDRLERLGAGGAEVASQLYGIDLDEDAHRLARDREWLGLDPGNILDRDFFSVEPPELPPIDALIGNPPYIRYQDFNGSAALARQVALRAGVRLTRLASSWAPFVVHATSFVAPGGRFAQVLPGELMHAQYAQEVVEFLRREFERIFVAVFDERVFPGALEDVVLLFAEGRGAPGEADVCVIPCTALDDVEDRLEAAGRSPGVQLESGRGRLLSQLLPAEAQLLYDRLSTDSRMQRLGAIASVDIGIVTGANEFFVLTEADAGGLHSDLVMPAVAKAVQVAGARLSARDHRELLKDGQRGLMLVADTTASSKALKSIQAHVARGEAMGLDERYKCRIREPWWALPVPRQGAADLLLTYCSDEHPRLALNEAKALSTNTIHGVRISNDVDGAALAAGFYNSLTLLSAELEGRSYGGGVLKLEPTEAEQLLLPPLSPGLAALLPAVDRAIRARDIEAAADLVDPVVLASSGLGTDEISVLRAARRQLQIRRKNRGRPPSR